MDRFLLLLFMASLSAISQVQENLLLHYTFAGHTEDITSNEYHGTPYAVTFTEDRFGNPEGAAYFNGMDSYVDLPNIVELKPQLPLSISFWIRFDSDNWQDREVFNTSHEEDKSSGVFFNTEASTGKYTLNFGDGTSNYSPYTRRTLVSDETVVTGEWVHIAAVIRGATDMDIAINCKINGGSYTGEGGDLFYSSTPGSIGRHDRTMGVPANHFKGAIDDFMYWNRALSQEEIGLLCQPLSISDQEDVGRILMYPNPATQKLHFSKIGFENKGSIEIFDSFGKRILFSPMVSELDISTISGGIYFVKISNEKMTSSRKLIIQ